ncbi:MAG: hypothetical protein KME64_27410 [Scytonematopsis contorta HA4267-MV1]|nr:hypothetical protein [Scytonematopsis contorta HA4267-MV1]
MRKKNRILIKLVFLLNSYSPLPTPHSPLPIPHSPLPTPEELKKIYLYLFNVFSW